MSLGKVVLEYRPSLTQYLRVLVRGPRYNTLQLRDVVDKILSEGAHYNFFNIHLISDFVDLFPKFVSLPQYSTDIAEFMHKACKDAYHRSNKVDLLF